MANLPETSTFDAGVYQIETTDPVQGGVSGKTNQPLKNLVNRTRWLKDTVDSISATLLTLATLASPTLTGTPLAPTPAAGDNSTKIATTAFVQAAASGVSTVSVAGGANVTLTQPQWGVGIVILTGVITANINVIFPTQADKWIVLNNTTGAFAITCKTAAGTGIVVKQGKSREIFCDTTNILASESDYDSVALTGAPTAPTATGGDNSTKIATTAFVQAALQPVFGTQLSIAAAATTDMGSIASRLIRVTGSAVNISSFGSSAASNNPLYMIQFAAGVTLVNGANLALPGGANIVTEAEDYLTALYLGAGAWRVLEYQRASALLLPAAFASNAETQAGAITTKPVTPGSLASLTALDTRAGLVELATNAETQTGTDTARAVTPAGLASLTATSARAGLVELATNAETTTGTDTARAVTPAGVAAAILAAAPVAASTTVSGLIELATNAEVQAGVDAVRAVTPAGLVSLTALDTRAGLVELATNAEATTGTDTVRAVTPAGVAAAITARAPVGASDTVAGIIELATNAEVIAGADAVRAVTPAGLAARTATDTRAGIVELATPAESLTGTDTARAVTPQGLKSVIDASAPVAASEAAAGIVEFADTAEVTAGVATNKAISPARAWGFIRSVAANGYLQIPFTPLIIQWGKYNSGSSNGTITLPITYPNANFIVVMSPLSEGSSTQTVSRSVMLASLRTAPGLSSFGFYTSSENEITDVFEADTGVQFWWFSIGF